MNDSFDYTASCGLKCKFVKRKGFVGKYAGIGVHYGASHRRYSLDGVIYESKSGIAHFLEHKLFITKDGRDILEEMNRCNAMGNAYTSHEQTIYYFNTNDSLDKPLELLLTMFFNPGFTDENVESEKNIILSEYESTMDDVSKRIHNYVMDTLYPMDTFQEEILGTKEDIESMTSSDLYEVYSRFYTPENSLLVVVADDEPKRIFEMIEGILAPFTFHHQKAIRLPFGISKEPLAPSIIYEDVPYPELHIVGRIPNLDYHTPLIPNIFIALLDGSFSVEAPFYKKLVEEELLISDDIEYSIASFEYGAYYHIEVYTADPQRLLGYMKEKLDTFSEQDFHEDIAMSTIKLYLCDYIRALDSISYVGDECITLGLEGTDYQEEFKLLKSLLKEDILKYVPYIRNSRYSYVMVFPKEYENEE